MNTNDMQKNNHHRTPHRSSVSHAPFAVVNRKSGQCPSCGWLPPEGGVLRGRGIRMSLRIHCYREHGLRLSLGDRKRMPMASTSGIDLDAETAAHLWVVEHALRRFPVRPVDEAMQEGRMGLLAAILLWDSRRGVSFCGYASRIIRQRVGIATSEAEEAERLKPAGSPLRVMLPPSPDPADTPLATQDEVAKAMRSLPEVQRNILQRLFCENPETLEEIGRRIGCCKERVRQIKLAAIRRLRTEITGEADNIPKEPKPKEPKPKKPRPKGLARFGSACPGRFVVLWKGLPTRMDYYGTLRLADGEAMSVFTDRRMALKLEQNLRVRTGDTRDDVVIVDADLLEGERKLVDSLPPMQSAVKKNMTFDAIRDELAKNGPMTTRQIAWKLMMRDGYVETRHPGLLPDAKDLRCFRLALAHVYRTVTNYIGKVPSLSKTGGGRSGPPVYSVAC